MHELVIRLKSGREFTVICEEYSLTRNGFGEVLNINLEGLQNIKPIQLDPSQIELIYEVLPQAPELITCKDCIHNVGVRDNTTFWDEDITCDYWETDGLQGDDFCSYGEGSTDEIN